MYAYAESKGELASRKTALTELYNGMNADIDAELTADLVGDYLFTDKDFINKLTGNRTLFQKVWDEVKYLCKVATGKELTEIEKVEREFAKAWKEQGQIAQSEENGDVKYSVSSNAALERFGVTDAFERTGFVTAEGKMLNLSRYGQNGVQHKIIEQIYDDVKGSDAITRFISEGNVRISAVSPGIEISAEIKPTVSQLNAISRFASQSLGKKDVFYVDVLDKNGDRVGTMEYSSDDDVYDIISDIKEYYNSGEIAEKRNGNIWYSISDGNNDRLDKFTKKQYNDFGWARYTGAITKNELDDVYSKVQEKGSLKKFAQSSSGEAIVEVNDKPHTTLGTDNVFVFATGTKNNPKITKVVRFQVETDIEMEIIKEQLYERGSFSNTYCSFLEQYGIAREYSKKSALDYTEYKEKVRRGSSGTEIYRANGNSGVEQNGTRTVEQTQSNEIAPINEVSSTDDAFFEAEKKQFSISTGKNNADEYDTFAVERGDTETAQKMVDEAAKNASVSNSHLDNGTDWVYNGNDLYTGSDSFVLEIDKGDRNHFARSLANKTSNLEKNEIRTVEIYGANKVYFFKATGYMQGRVLKSVSASNYNGYIKARKEYANGINGSTEAFDTWTNALSAYRKGAGSDISDIGIRQGKNDADGIYGRASERNGTGTQERSRQNFRDDTQKVESIVAELRKKYGLTENHSTNEIAPINEVSSTDDAFFDGKISKHSLSYEGEQFAPTGNYSTPLNETALDIAPVAEGVAENATIVLTTF